MITTMPRLDPVGQENMPDSYPAIENVPDIIKEEWEIDKEWLNESTLLQVFANNPEVLRLHTEVYLSLWGGTGLSVRENELVILTVSRELETKLEWQVHAGRAIAAGCTEEEIIALSNKDYEKLDDKTATLIKYVRAVINRGVTDDLHNQMADHYDDSTIMGTMFLASYYRGYTMCGFALDWTIEDSPRGEFIGWELENYDSSHQVAIK